MLDISKRDMKKYIITILIIFVSTRLVIFSFFLISESIEKQGNFQRANQGGAYYVDIPLVKYFVYYDTYHYMNIAKYGYGDSERYPKLSNHNYFDNMEACYFPLYPFLIRIFMFTGLRGETIGFIISNLCFLGFLFIFKYLLLYYRIRSNVPLVALCLFPGSIFLSVVYTESLCLFLTAACMSFCARKVGSGAAIFGFLAGVSRNSGVLLCAFMAFRYMEIINWNFKRIRWNFILCAFPAFGLGVFMIVSQLAYGNPIMFVTMQKMYLRQMVDPVTYLFSDVLSGNFYNAHTLANLLCIYIMTVVMVVMLVDKKFPLSLKVIAVLVALLSMSTVLGYPGKVKLHTVGYVRYILPAIPLFMYIGKMHKYFKAAVICVFSFCLMIFSLLFYFNAFIA